jgi:hypothetical protein
MPVVRLVTLLAPAALALAADAAHAQRPAPVLRADAGAHGSPVAVRERARAAASTGARCPGPVKGLRAATLATSLFALPVAAIAYAVSDDRWRAARWATYGGAAWSYGVTAWMMMRAGGCHSTDGLAYVWTPVAATAGAIAVTR